jgi:8-oxo-dGTP pyrophosphatase MutT (NUDIX family)
MDKQYCIPFVGGIIERQFNGQTELLIQTRWKPERDPKYSGTFEFTAGTMDIAFESAYDTLRREIEEETGLKLKSIKNDSQTKTYSPQRDDKSFGFRPFCCVQQLKNGRPWVGFIFLCEVEDGELKAQESQLKDLRWVSKKEMYETFTKTPEKIFTLEIPAWEYYFNEFGG